MVDDAGREPNGTQTVVVPWEWVGEPGDETSSPIFGRMELPRVFRGLGSGRHRELGLPAPGESTSYRLDVSRAGVGRLTYRFRGRETSQLVQLVKGINVIWLVREHEPTA